MSRIEGMKMTEEIKGKFIFEKDTKRYHRFKIVFDEDMSGTIYIPKEIESSDCVAWNFNTPPFF